MVKPYEEAYESEEDKRRRKQGVLPDSNTGKYKLHVISAFATEWESPLDSYAHKKRKMR